MKKYLDTSQKDYLNQQQSLDIHPICYNNEIVNYDILTMNTYDEDNRLRSRSTIYRKSKKGFSSVCDLVGEIINSDYDTATNKISKVKISCHQKEVAKILAKRKESRLTKDKYDNLYKQFTLILRNKQIAHSRMKINQQHFGKRYYQNVTIPSSPELRRVEDALFHNAFIVPIECSDLSLEKELPGFIHNFVNNKLPQLTKLEQEINTIKVYSNISLNWAEKEKIYVTSCLISISNNQGILCSFFDYTDTDDSTVPELIGILNASSLLNKLIQKQGTQFEIMSKNKNAVDIINKVKNKKTTKYNSIVQKILDNLPACSVTHITNKKSAIFSLLGQESNFILENVINT